MGDMDGASVFGVTMDNNFVKNNGLFDKLFIDCSFKEPFLMNGKTFSGKCDHFQRTLTSNGLCMSFNSFSPSHTWKNSILIKSLEEITESNRNILKFGGTGSNEGEFQLFSRIFPKVS